MEERPVRIGDNVIFEDKLYKITEIYNDKSIKISNEDDELVLQHEDYLNNNKIKFISIFTGEQWIDMDILAFMDDSDLEIMCRFDDYISELCNGEDLWMIKLEPKYENILDYVKDDYELKYKYLLIHGIGRWSANYAAGDGHLDILKWLKKEYNVLPEQYGADWAAAGGYLKVLIWLEKHNILPGHSGVNRAAENGHLDVLIWLKERDILPDNYYGANAAAGNGHLDVLNWLKENNNILPNMGGASIAAGGGHIDVLIWLEDNNILPGQVGANWAAGNGHLHILEWIYNKNKILPDQNSVNRAAKNGHLHILEWLEKYEIFPDE